MEAGGWGGPGAEMLEAARARAQVVRPGLLGRARTPPGLGWAAGARALRQALDSALEAEGGGGGKVPVTSGCRGKWAGTAGRGRGGYAR